MFRSKTVVTVDGKKYGLGKKPHKKDDRDWMLRDVPPEKLEKLMTVGQNVVTGSTDWRRYYMGGHDFRINQGQEGTCTGHGTTNVLINGPTTHPDFPRFATPYEAHMFARELYLGGSGDLTYQEGAYTRDVLMYALGQNYLGAFYRLASVDEIVHTLLTLCPVTFGCRWYNSMFTPYAKYDNMYVRVNPDSGVAGGHLFCLTGIDLSPTYGPPYVRMENSWGESWAKNGTARISIDDLNILYDGDTYVLTEAPF